MRSGRRTDGASWRGREVKCEVPSASTNAQHRLAALSTRHSSTRISALSTRTSTPRLCSPPPSPPAPNAVALEWACQEYTFADLDRRATRMAHELDARGLGAGDRLAIYLPNRIEYIDLFLACTRLGVIVVPINVLYRDREMSHILGDATPKAVVVADDVGVGACGPSGMGHRRAGAGGRRLAPSRRSTRPSMRPRRPRSSTRPARPARPKAP